MSGFRKLLPSPNCFPLFLLDFLVFHLFTWKSCLWDIFPPERLPRGCTLSNRRWRASGCLLLRIISLSGAGSCSFRTAERNPEAKWRGKAGGSARRKGRGPYTATQETRRPYGRRVLPQKRGERLAAAATTMVVLAAVVISAEQDEDDDEQNPGAIVATEQILQAHTGRPPFFGTHSIIRGGREVVTANRHPAAETGLQENLLFFSGDRPFPLALWRVRCYNVTKSEAVYAARLPVIPLSEPHGLAQR